LLVVLPARQGEAQQLAAALDPDVQLGAEAPATAPKGLIAPPFRAPAACWCARTLVPSTKCSDQSSRPAASASAWSPASTRSQTPARRQRRKRLYTVSQGPNRSGRSRQGAPVRSSQYSAFKISR